MRIIAVSDLHGQFPPLPEGDILVIGGDVCPDYQILGDFRQGAHQQGRWLDTTFRAWLESLNFKAIIGICGNHDFVFERPSLVPDLPWTYLQDSEVEVEGKKFWGTPWVPRLRSWAFYGNERALQLRAEMIPENIDVLISHGPPYGALDRVGEQLVGDTNLNEIIKRVKPEVLFCGHIHEGYGHETIGSTEAYNVSVVDEFYDLVHPATVVDI